MGGGKGSQHEPVALISIYREGHAYVYLPQRGPQELGHQVEDHHEREVEILGRFPRKEHSPVVLRALTEGGQGKRGG